MISLVLACFCLNGLAPHPPTLPPTPPIFIRAFHPAVNMAYVVNELSSTVSVYEFNVGAARAYEAGDTHPMLRFVQSVSTIPSAFPRKMNTCGRICVDPTGRCVRTQSIEETNQHLCLSITPPGCFQRVCCRCFLCLYFSCVKGGWGGGKLEHIHEGRHQSGKGVWKCHYISAYHLIFSQI